MILESTDVDHVDSPEAQVLTMIRKFLLASVLLSTTSGQISAQVACDQISVHVSVCSDAINWNPTPPRGHAAAEFRGPNGFYGQIIIEQAGSDNGLTAANAVDVALKHARNMNNGKQVNVLLRGKNSETFNREIVVFETMIEGIPFIFANSVTVGRTETVQIVTWRVNDTLAEEDRSRHIEFGNVVRFLPGF